VTAVPAVPNLAGAATGDPCGPSGNAISCENSLPGTDPAAWELGYGAGDESIQGFATDISVDAGNRIDFKVDTDATPYTIDIYRTGYYQGLGARHVASVPVDVALPQQQPVCMTDLPTELTDCGNWAVSAHWNVPADAVSGVYIATLERTDTGGRSHITFIVRDDDSHSDLVFQTSDPTWHAYNTYGGSDFYQGAANGRAYKISYNRPFATRGHAYGRDFYFASEYAMVRYLEQNGYDVSYIAGADTDRSGGLLLNHKTFLSVGHDEYWSAAQRANVEAARDAGVNLAFFSGNEVYWHTRWEPSVAGEATDYRTLVSYKETWSNVKVDPATEWTGTWRDPRFAGQENGAGLPENGLTGTMYMANDDDLPVTVTAAEGKLRLWRETDLTNLAAGTAQELAPHTVGYESDEDLDNGFRPAGLIRLSTTIGDTPQYLEDFGNTVAPGTTEHHLTLYRAASGALVFGAGTIQWAWGLDQTHDGDGAPADPRMRQATMNLLADMGAQPATPAAGLVATPASTDTTGPTVRITTPVAQAAVANGTLVTVTGTASDVGGRVAGIEVSLDGGSTWHPATGRESWTYTGVQHGAGAVQVQARATDDSANTGQPASVEVAVTCPCTVFGDTTPATPSADDAAPLELGLRFVPQADGYVAGVRFYKGEANTGTHSGSLWSATGQRLAQVTFTGESASGWQTARFETPVAVTAGQPYVVSYTAPNGGYATQAATFSLGGLVATPLAVEGGFGAPAAGLFGSAGSFPQTTWGDATYFVDPVFEMENNAPLTVSGRTPGATAASVPLTTTVGATFSKNVDPASVSIHLVDSAGADVAGTTAYDAASRHVTFTPSAELQGFVEYTATVSATSVEGQTVSAGGTWTFRTVRPPSSSCPCSVFSDALTPTLPAAADAQAVTLGMRFTAAQAGTVDAVRFYKTDASAGPFTVTLWDGAGTVLATAPVTVDVSTGWQEVRLATPVAVTAGATYTVGYRTATGNYPASPGALGGPLTSGPLATPANAGVYSYADAYPATQTSTSYLVDVLFSPAATVPTVTALTPADGAVDVDPAATVSATASVPLAAGAAVTVTDALGVAVAGAASVSPDGTTASFVPAAPLGAGAVYTASFAGTTTSGTALTASWSFTVAAAPGDGSCPCTLFGAATPAAPAASDGAAVELGTAFTPAQDGYVTAVRFFKGAGNGGTHTGSLWNAAGDRLATVTFTNETATGWQTATFSEPVPVDGGSTYVASYLAPQGHYAADAGYFAQTRTAGPLTAPADAGRYVYGDGFPRYTYGSTNYWVDAVFADGPPRVAQATPAAGDLAVPVTSTVTARLASAPVDAQPTITLTQGVSPVDGASAYDAATRTVTFTPSAALPHGATITASVTLAGATLSTWSFTTEPVPVTTGFQTIWSASDVPAQESWNDTQDVQVGTRFAVNVAGQIAGIRFYKGSANTGTHTGYLWTTDGALLASGTFTGETASGWQTLTFATPVPVAAGQQLVASYRAPAGGYAATGGALAEARTSGPLVTLAPGGAYVYGSAGFPGGTSPASYWVDVLFRADAAAP
jgi:hypothetical protein